MEQIPTLVSNAIINLSDNKIVLLLAINVLLLIVGMFMETLSAMIVLTPLLLAIVTPLGYNPIQFGVHEKWSGYGGTMDGQAYGRTWRLPGQGPGCNGTHQGFGRGAQGLQPG